MSDKKLWWDIDPIWNEDCILNLVFGQRSNGKTYGVNKKGPLELWVENGNPSCYMRRFDESIRPKNIKHLLDPFADPEFCSKGNGYLSELTNGKFNTFVYTANEFYPVYKNPETGKIEERSVTPCLRCVSLNTMETWKGQDGGYYNIICFDEAISRESYLNNEYDTFLQCLSSIARLSEYPTKVFILANSLQKYNPYFDEFGINVEELEQGKIHIFVDQQQNRMAVEYCAAVQKRGIMSKIFNTKKHSLDMILTGIWNEPLYPRIKFSYKKQGTLYLCDASFVLAADLIISEYGAIAFYIHKNIDIRKPPSGKSFAEDKEPETGIKFFNRKCAYVLSPDGSGIHSVSFRDTPTELHEYFVSCMPKFQFYFDSNDTGERFVTFMDKLQRGFKTMFCSRLD